MWRVCDQSRAGDTPALELSLSSACTVWGPLCFSLCSPNELAAVGRRPGGDAAGTGRGQPLCCDTMSSDTEGRELGQ